MKRMMQYSIELVPFILTKPPFATIGCGKSKDSG